MAIKQQDFTSDFDAIAQPRPEPVICDFKPECGGCPYVRHGFMCYNARDGTCFVDWMRVARLNKLQMNHS